MKSELNGIYVSFFPLPTVIILQPSADKEEVKLNGVRRNHGVRYDNNRQPPPTTNHNQRNETNNQQTSFPINTNLYFNSEMQMLFKSDIFFLCFSVVLCEMNFFLRIPDNQAFSKVKTCEGLVSLSFMAYQPF